MKIDCIADLHGYEPELPGGDLLILAGDYTAADQLLQWSKFFTWLKAQNYEKKILIAGNHDNFFKTGFPTNQKEANDLKEVQAFLEEQKEMDKPDFEYLCDSGTEYLGLKIWGTPWTPWFKGVNPKCKAFMDSEGDLAKRFKLIPKGLDILISHGPPYAILDKVELGGGICKRVGSLSLAKKIDEVKPKIVICGHIHEGYGFDLDPNTMIKYINCSYVNGDYQPVNKYIRVTL